VECSLAIFAALAVSWLVAISISLRESVDMMSSLETESRAEIEAQTLVPTSVSDTLAEQAEVSAIETEPNASFSLPFDEVVIADLPMFKVALQGPDPLTGEMVSTYEEIGRGENFSYLESSRGDIDQLIALFRATRGPVVWDEVTQAVLHFQGGVFSRFACYRGFSHWFVVAEREQPGFYIFLTNDEYTPIDELLGDKYSEDAQVHFDRRGYYLAGYEHPLVGPESCIRGQGNLTFVEN
jgi:hypothetical protein